MRFKGKKPLFSVEDTWSLDEVLNPIIASGLKKFREVSLTAESSYPSSLSSFEEWLVILDKMVFAFDSKEPETEGEYVEYDFANTPNGDGNYEVAMVVSCQDSYDKRVKEIEEHGIKVQKGLDLFAKYYKHLWW